MTSILLVVVLLVFAVQAIRARALLTSALWLAGVSALTSVLLFVYGARLVSVIELSVGAGLVTVLFVFAINLAGDEALDARPVPPLPLVVGITLLFILLMGWFVWPVSIATPATRAVPEPALAEVLWRARGLDLLVQIVLIFSGVLGLLGLLAEAKPPLEGSMAAEVAAGRDRDMQAWDVQIPQIPEMQEVDR